MTQALAIWRNDKIKRIRLTGPVTVVPYAGVVEITDEKHTYHVPVDTVYLIITDPPHQ